MDPDRDFSPERDGGPRTDGDAAEEGFPGEEGYPDEWESPAWAPDDIDLLRDADKMLSVYEAQRLRHIDSLRLEAVTEAAGHGLTSPDVAERSLRLELALLMRITEYAAGVLMARAQALVHRYPAVLESLSYAGMTPQHAAHLATVLDTLAPDVRARIVPPAVVLAETEPVGTFKRKLARLIEKAQAPTIVERHEAALSQRRVFVEADLDGMAWLHAYLPAVEVHAIHGRLTAISKTISRDKTPAQNDTDPDTDTDPGTDPDADGVGPRVPAPDDAAVGRTLDQLRADVLGDLLIDGSTPSHPDAARGIRAEVVVTVPALSLLDDAHAATADPPVVEGVGPIPIARARELCGDSRDWMRILTHPETGMVVSVGRDRYRPPAAIRRLVEWRAGRCITPGCGMPAGRCEIDHRIEWAAGGETSVTNLDPLCKGHHIVRHNSRWRLTRMDDGVTRWTSPAGRVYLVEPERRLPAFIAPPVPEPPPF